MPCPRVAVAKDGSLVIRPPQTTLTAGLLDRVEANDHGSAEEFGAQASVEWIFT